MKISSGFVNCLHEKELRVLRQFPLEELEFVGRLNWSCFLVTEVMKIPCFGKQFFILKNEATASE